MNQKMLNSMEEAYSNLGRCTGPTSSLRKLALYLLFHAGSTGIFCLCKRFFFVLCFAVCGCLKKIIVHIGHMFQCCLPVSGIGMFGKD